MDMEMNIGDLGIFSPADVPSMSSFGRLYAQDLCFSAGSRHSELFQHSGLLLSSSTQRSTEGLHLVTEIPFGSSGLAWRHGALPLLTRQVHRALLTTCTEYLYFIYSQTLFD